jgi:hypothetical protein
MACSFQPDNLAKYFVKKDSNGIKSPNGTKFAHFTNPVQSYSLKNCPLIAALSSIAWVNKAIFTPDRGTATEVNFTFYDFASNGSVTPRKVYVNSNLFSENNNPCGATSNNWDTVDHESWPALWEKAFAKFCMYKILCTYTLADLRNSAKDPVYSQLPNGSDWGGNPVTVTKWIMNKSALYYAPRDASFTYGASTYTNFYDIIKKGICSTTNIPAGCNGAKTLASMGAWTYLNNAAANEHSQYTTVTYDTTALVADHCYSLLGMFEENAKRYIVLRNPFGKYDPTGLPSGPWKYKQGASTLTFSFTPNDGVFALEESTFSDYFEMFGVVY